MKRILICSHQFSLGGLSLVVRALRETLVRLGHLVDILAPSYSTCGKVDLPVPSLNVAGLPGSFSFWKLATRMARKRRYHYDLIMMHHPVLLSSKSLKLGNKVVITFHGTYYGYARAYHLYKLGWYAPYYDLAARIEKRLLDSLSDHQDGEIVVTGVSPSTISELRANGYADVAQFVPNAMPHVHEIVSKKRARNLLSRCTHLRIDLDDNVLLYVGSSKNVASKRPLLVPSFFREVTKRDPKMKLVMVGGGSLSHRLERLTRESDNIFYLGFIPQDQLHFLYSCADAYISLSCYEGLPNSVLEAAAYGLPLILSDIPAHRWIISERIGHGVLVNSFNPVDDADKVRALLESTDDLRYYPDSDVRMKFSWSQIAKGYLRIAEIPID